MDITELTISINVLLPKFNFHKQYNVYEFRNIRAFEKIYADVLETIENHVEETEIKKVILDFLEHKNFDVNCDEVAHFGEYTLVKSFSIEELVKLSSVNLCEDYIPEKLFDYLLRDSYFKGNFSEFINCLENCFFVKANSWTELGKWDFETYDEPKNSVPEWVVEHIDFERYGRNMESEFMDTGIGYFIQHYK